MLHPCRAGIPVLLVLLRVKHIGKGHRQVLFGATSNQAYRRQSCPGQRVGEIEAFVIERVQIAGTRQGGITARYSLWRSPGYSVTSRAWCFRRWPFCTPCQIRFPACPVAVAPWSCTPSFLPMTGRSVH